VIIISHAHLDHFGGLPTVLDSPDITVGEVYYNGYDSTTQSWYAPAHCSRLSCVRMSSFSLTRRLSSPSSGT
jgi:beta-lactamase superfamily II metal-dependent hydrolase